MRITISYFVICNIFFGDLESCFTKGLISLATFIEEVFTLNFFLIQYKFCSAVLRGNAYWVYICSQSVDMILGSSRWNPSQFLH
jgi:hypothetical protein